MIKLKQMYNALKKNDQTKTFFSDLVNAQIMVLDNRNSGEHNEGTLEECRDFFLNYKINLPFETVWIECIAENGVDLVSAEKNSRTMRCDTVGILIREVSPTLFRGHYFFNATRSDIPSAKTNNNLVGFSIQEGELPPDFGKNQVNDTLLIIATKTLRHLLDALNDRNTYGTTTHNTVLKKGVGESSYRKEINTVIHIRKKLSEKKEASIETPLQEFDKETIDWTHRWRVRGHWRKTDGIGKNRNGEYGVAGFTWVVEHIKGNENLPLIEKTRILHQNGP